MNNTNHALKLVFYLVAAVLLLWNIYQLKMLIISLSLAVMLAAAIAPLAEAAEKKRIPRAATVSFVYATAAIMYVFLAVSIAPAIREQGMKLYESFPSYISGLEKWYQSALNVAGNHADITVSTEDLRELLVKVLRQTLDMTAGLIGLVLGGVLILFLSAYFVIEARTIWPALLKWLPPKARARCSGLIVPLESRIGGYVRGQLLVAMAVALIIVTGLSLLGVKYALLLGLLAGVLNFVPYVGSLLVTGFAVIIAFNQTPSLALVTILFFAIEQWIESTFLVPILLGKHVELHPLIVLIAILAGASLMGIAGALISIPAASAALFLAEEFYLKSLPKANDEKS